MTDHLSNDVATAAYLAREEYTGPLSTDDRPSPAELAEDGPEREPVAKDPDGWTPSRCGYDPEMGW